MAPYRRFAAQRETSALVRKACYLLCFVALQDAVRAQGDSLVPAYIRLLLGEGCHRGCALSLSVSLSLSLSLSALESVWAGVCIFLVTFGFGSRDFFWPPYRTVSTNVICVVTEIAACVNATSRARDVSRACVFRVCRTFLAGKGGKTRLLGDARFFFFCLVSPRVFHKNPVAFSDTSLSRTNPRGRVDCRAGTRC